VSSYFFFPHGLPHDGAGREGKRFPIDPPQPHGGGGGGGGGMYGRTSGGKGGSGMGV